MKDQDRTKEQLVNELVELRQRMAELEAVDIERKRAEEEIWQRNRELAALNAIATVVSQSLNLDEILNAALDKVLELMHLDVGGIYLADPVRRKLDLIVHRGTSEEFAHEIESVIVDEKTLEAVTAEGKLRRFTLAVEAVVKDRAELKRIRSSVKKEGLNLTFGVPVLLQAREEIQGLMIVASRVPRQYSEAELQLLTYVGQQIAIAIKNARLFEETRRRLRELESLAQASAAIISTLELHPRLENILSAAMAVVPAAEKGSILLVDEATGELAIQILIGYSDPRIPSARFPREAGYSAKAVREGRPLLIPDARTDPSIRYDGEIEEIRAILSAAVVPLQVKGRIIGVIALDNASRKAAFNEDDLRLLTTFADQAAIAIENARLYEATQQELAERKRAEEALRESERKLRLIAENTTDVIFAYDMDRRLIYVNPAVEELTGYSVDELRERNFISWLHPEDEARMMKLWEELFEGKGFSGEEFRIVTKDGQVKWGLSSWGPVYDESGRQIGIQGRERDITERKRAEGELIRLSNAVRMSTDSIVIGDLEAKIVDVNEATLRMYGTDDKGDLVGKNSFDLIAPEDREKAFVGMEETLERGSIEGREYHIIIKDSSRIPVEMSVALMKDVDGKPVGFVSVIRDITERVRAERLLQALNQAALAMGKAMRPEEIFTTVAEELKKLGFSCVVLLTDESQKRLFPTYFSYETGAIKAAEKLVGLKVDGLSIPVETVDVYRKIVRERKSILVEDSEEVVRQLLPGPAKRLAGQIAKMLKASKSIDVPLIVEDKVIGLFLVQSDHLAGDDIPAITAFAHQMAAAWRKATLLQALEKSLVERKRAQEELQQSFKQLRRALEGTVNVLVSAIEMKDPYTAGHQWGVTQLACAIAKEIGLPEDRIEGLRMAGLIHDIGKIKVPAEILSKPGPLTELEFGLIKMHPQVGHDVLNGTIEFPWPVAEIVLQHHERMDGSGYPQGLSGEEIILEARILGVADVVEAMASHRPYRSARGIDQALEEISQNRSVLYDPEVVDACLRLFTEKGFRFEDERST